MDALTEFGNVTDLPPDVVASLVLFLSGSLEQQGEEAKKGRYALHDSDFLGTLVLINAWHPEQSDWPCVLKALSLKESHPTQLSDAINWIIRLENKLPTEIKNELIACISEIADRPGVTSSDKCWDPRDVRILASRAISNLSPNIITDKELRQKLSSHKIHVRIAAIHALVKRRTHCHSDLLILNLCIRDSNEKIREAAVEGIANWVVDAFGLPESETILNEILDKGPPQYATWASRALNKNAIETLSASRLADKLGKQTSALVRARVKAALE